MTRVEPVDVAVSGGGPVGCALALALHAKGCRVVVLDPRPFGTAGEPAAGFRPVALSYASRLILERLAAWPAPSVTPIDSIRVSQWGAPGRVLLSAKESGVPALGYVAAYDDLVAKLRRCVVEAGIPTQSAALQAVTRDADGLGLHAAGPDVDRRFVVRLLVHAEGAARDMRERHYHRDALVARVSFNPPATQTAFERFTPDGPLALLPHRGQFGIVWSLDSARAHELAAAPEGRVLDALAPLLPAHCGTPEQVSDRSVTPLVLRTRCARVRGREVFVGNAAQTLHPVSGQGLNLGLRDAWDLAAHCADAPDPGASGALRRYAAARRPDALAAIASTDALVRTFAVRNAGLPVCRGAMMTLLDSLPAARRFLTRRMMFGPSAIP